MKKILSMWLLVLTAAYASAQKKTRIIYRDTINLRGYVYNDQGKPMSYLYIESTQPDPKYNEFKAASNTDTTGFFEIRGAKFNDTLTFARGSATYYTTSFYNRDSRYVVIYLAPKVNDINSTHPVEVNHRRKYPKIIPALSIQTFDRGDYFGDFSQPAEYPGGVGLFENYLRNNLKYPEEAIKNNAEGTVQIAFTVEKDGRLGDFKILRGIGYGCDQEVVNLLRRSRAWRPVIDHGRPYIAKETVSVKFSLTDK